MKKVGMFSLGCAKNQVDTEMILGMLEKDNFEVTNEIDECDLIIINTCGFIESAKEEALSCINSVLESKKANQKLVVCGCYAERYFDKLNKEYKNIDAIIPLKKYHHFAQIINELFKEGNDYALSFYDRVLVSPFYAPYVRIADGCDNRCSFCAIPLIRGPYVSRTIDDILVEVNELVKNGAKEINLISQDTTRYGADLNDEKKSLLPELLKEIDKIEGINMIRCLYLYPDLITKELIDTIKNSKKVCHYFDVPIQHSSSSQLSLMNRRGDHDFLVDLFKYIRKEVPDAIIRTTLIVGFPYESEEDFKELCEFVKETKFYHLGCFTYSKEEDTKGYDMPQIDEEIKQKRYDEIMSLQKSISYKLKRESIGKTYTALVDSYEDGYYYLRNYMFAPDEIDGYIVASNDLELDIELGDIVEVKITSAFQYDLIGKIIKKA